MVAYPRYWIGVACREHVLRGLAGGFCQLCHGKAQRLRRMAQGDWIAYYSPRQTMDAASPACQAFTALGRLKDGNVYSFAMSADFIPFRRDVEFLPAREAPIRPLVAQLDFIRDKQRWGYAFRYGHLEVSRQDFATIAQAMGHVLPPPGTP
ncbi:MAG: EVE domain-containing protein [Rhodocyclaceae bacterium]|nr:MAG: EVE domain-containing protein [Rhodocyclaceae bacterium]